MSEITDEMEIAAYALWRVARPRLADLAGEAACKAWLSALLPLHDDGEELVMGAPTAFMAEHIREKFGEALDDACGRRVAIHQDSRAANAWAGPARGYTGRGW